MKYALASMSRGQRLRADVELDGEVQPRREGLDAGCAARRG